MSRNRRHLLIVFDYILSKKIKGRELWQDRIEQCTDCRKKKYYFLVHLTREESGTKLKCYRWKQITWSYS